MDVAVLGALQITGDEGPVALTGRHTPVALSWLAMHANQPVRLERLATVVWAEPGPGVIRTLRVALRNVAAALSPGDLTVGESARLAVGHGALDSDRFRELARDARRCWACGDLPGGAARAGAAIALWRGDPYPDLQDCVDALPVIQRLRDDHLDMVELQQEAALAGEVDFATVAALRQLAASHPERRTYRLQLARALHIVGRQVESLQVLRELAQEWGDDALTRRVTTLIASRDPAARSMPTVEVTPTTVS